MNLTERIETFILSNIAHPEKRKIGVEVECMFYNKKMKRLPVDLCEAKLTTALTAWRS